MSASQLRIHQVGAGVEKDRVQLVELAAFFVAHLSEHGYGLRFYNGLVGHYLN